MKRRCIALLFCLLIAVPLTISVSCDCHPSANQIRVCLFYEPFPTLTMVDDHFDFAVKIRNFYRTSTGEAITDITGSVVSCTRSDGASCTWSTNGNTDFLITINPSYIASSVGGDFGVCTDTPSACRTCNTGRVETMNSRITVKNAADGTYTIRYRVGWQPNNRERFVDVTISFTSAGGCTSDSQCSGSTPRCNTATGQCVACTSASHCNDNNPCTNDACTSNSCIYSNVASGTACTNGFCCNGVCDTTTGNTNYHADCRTGPVCSGTSWEYAIANNGNLCGGYACMECNNGQCNSPDSTRCPAGQSCSAGTCVSSCTDECLSGQRRCSGTSKTETCGNYDADSCLEWGGLQSCQDNVCKIPTCANGVCGETNVANGMTDAGCSGSTGCTGGSCACNGAGQCTSQPTCTDECTSGQRDCSGNFARLCGNYDADPCLEWQSTDCQATGRYCFAGQCVQCTQNSHCNDNNACTTDSCSSNTCSNTILADGQACGSGFCCQGQCDLTVGNANFDSNCRTASPSCVGNSWEYSIANQGQLCGSTQCRQCNNGFCSMDNNSRCASGQSCSSGFCTSTCSDECIAGTKRCLGNSTQTCGEFDSDSCTEWGNTLICPDSKCKEPSCSNGICSEVNVSAGGTDESCFSSTGCTGGSCRCDGNGLCISQPLCTDECQASGQKDCSGNKLRTCGNFDSDICLEYQITDCSLEGKICQGGNCIIQSCSQAACGASDGCCPSACTASQDSDCSSSCSSIQPAQCENTPGCKLCPMNNQCYQQSDVQCTSSSCSQTGKYCLDCRWAACAGTNSSCSCINGVCSQCGSNEACIAGKCTTQRTSGTTTQTTTRCKSVWQCSNWSTCENRIQTRECIDTNNCGSSLGMPVTQQSCSSRTISGTTQPSASGPGRQTGWQNYSQTADSTAEHAIKTTARQKPNTLLYIIALAAICGAGMGLFFLFGRHRQQPLTGQQKPLLSTPPSSASMIFMRIATLRNMGYNQIQIKQELEREGFNRELIESVFMRLK